MDRDNFDQAPAKIGAALRLAIAGADAPEIPLRFAELDDFHPDRLLPRIELFDALRDLRRRLNDPAMFPAAAAEIRSWGAAQPAPASPAAPQAPAPAAPADYEDLLERMLGTPPAERPAPRPKPGAGEWGAFLSRIVGPHLRPP